MKSGAVYKPDLLELVIGNSYMNNKIIDISKSLKAYFLDDYNNLNIRSFFLCGGSGKNENALRKEIGK